MYFKTQILKAFLSKSGFFVFQLEKFLSHILFELRTLLDHRISRIQYCVT